MRKASITTDGFTMVLIDNIQKQIDLVNNAVSGLMVAVLALGAAIVLGGVIAGVAIAVKAKSASRGVAFKNSS